MKNMKKYFSTIDTPSANRRQGGISSVPPQCLLSYLQYINKKTTTFKEEEWLPPIRELDELIRSDPILRMNWEYGIFLCTQTLSGKSGDHVLDMIDAVCRTPPSFSHSSLVGFPINAILVEFMQNQNGRMFFSHERVNHIIKKILNAYGDMLLSPQSTKYLTTSEHGWFSPQAEEVIHNDWYKCDPTLPHYGYKCWNDWFLREFKDGMRPIGEGTPTGINPQNVIINSCQSAPLSKPKQPRFNVKLSDNFWFKDDVYSLEDMFGGIKYKKQHIAKQFVGGTVYQAFLSALYYHRWHAPVDGTIEDIYAIDGTYYLDQSQFIQYDEGSPNNSQSFLSAVAARKVFVIDCDNKNIGKLAIIYIGMAEVSSCVHTVNIGDKIKKGQQLGYFMFGGSSHAIIFQQKAKLKFKQKVYKFNKEVNSFESQKQNLFSYLAHIQVQEEPQQKLEEKKQTESKQQSKEKIFGLQNKIQEKVEQD